MQPPNIRAPLIAILIILVCAHFVRALLQIELSERGLQASYAKDLSYLVVPPILAVLLAPILISNKIALFDLLSFRRMNIRLILIAIAIGVLARVAYWCQLIFGVATGLASNSDPTAIQGPVMWFSCPPAPVLLLGLLVWICLVPFVEEVVHRGLIQSSLVHRGYWTAILVSALIFAAFHPPASMPLVFLFGVVFAFQFAHSGTLWSSIITHATYDGLIQIDWRCLHGMWNPPSDATPLISTAVLALTGLAMSGAGIVFLLLKTGAREAPRPAP